jgi:hypothetical protein
MSTRHSRPLFPQDRSDDGEDYVFIDARAVLLDVTDEPDARSGRPLLRGVQPPPTTTACDPETEWRAFLGAAGRDVVAEDAGPQSVWHRMTRRLQGVWSGARGTVGRRQ